MSVLSLHTQTQTHKCKKEEEEDRVRTIQKTRGTTWKEVRRAVQAEYKSLPQERGEREAGRKEMSGESQSIKYSMQLSTIIQGMQGEKEDLMWSPYVPQVLRCSMKDNHSFLENEILKSMEAKMY